MYEKKAMKPNNIYQHHQKYYLLSKGLKEYVPFGHQSFPKLQNQFTFHLCAFFHF